MADEPEQLKAGHPPAVKAGGMRIVQHKTPSTERPAKDAEDCTGLTPPVNITPSAMSIGGAPVKANNADFTTQAAQIARLPKPADPVQVRPIPNIQQPRK